MKGREIHAAIGSDVIIWGKTGAKGTRQGYPGGSGRPRMGT